MREQIRKILLESHLSWEDEPDYIYPNYTIEYEEGKILTADLYINTMNINEDYDDDKQITEAWVGKVVDSMSKKVVSSDMLPFTFLERINDPDFAFRLIEEIIPDSEDLYYEDYN